MGPAASFATAFLLVLAARGYELKQVLVTRIPEPDGSVRARREPKTVLLAGDRARLEEESGEVTVVRLDRGEVVRLDILMRSYERKTLREMRIQWRTLNELLLEQIAGTPADDPRRGSLIDELTDGPEKWREIWKLPAGPERDRLVRRYRLPENPPRVEIRRTRQTKDVGGVECVRYEGLEDGEVRDWAYIAPGLPFDARYYEFMELSGWLGPEITKGLRRTRGLPLETVMHARSGVEIALETESVVERNLEHELFEVPEGYVERKRRAGFD